MPSTPEMNVLLHLSLSSPKVTIRTEALLPSGGGRRAEDQQPPGPTGKAPHDPVVYNLTLWSTIKVPMTEKGSTPCTQQYIEKMQILYCYNLS